MSKAQLITLLQPVLASDVLLVSDGNPTYRYFAQDAHISHDTINLSAGLRVKGAVHIQNVNAYHGRLKQWIDGFHGVATRYLDNDLGWFAPWITITPTLGKASWLWLLGSFHI